MFQLAIHPVAGTVAPHMLCALERRPADTHEMVLAIMLLHDIAALGTSQLPVIVQEVLYGIIHDLLCACLEFLAGHTLVPLAHTSKAEGLPASRASIGLVVGWSPNKNRIQVDEGSARCPGTVDHMLPCGLLKHRLLELQARGLRKQLAYGDVHWAARLRWLAAFASQWQQGVVAECPAGSVGQAACTYSAFPTRPDNASFVLATANALRDFSNALRILLAEKCMCLELVMLLELIAAEAAATIGVLWADALMPDGECDMRENLVTMNTTIGCI